VILFSHLRYPSFEKPPGEKSFLWVCRSQPILLASERLPCYFILTFIDYLLVLFRRPGPISHALQSQLTSGSLLCRPRQHQWFLPSWRRRWRCCRRRAFVRQCEYCRSVEMVLSSSFPSSATTRRSSLVLTSFLLSGWRDRTAHFDCGVSGHTEHADFLAVTCAEISPQTPITDTGTAPTTTSFGLRWRGSSNWRESGAE
jgi:hypothetical protein